MTAPRCSAEDYIQFLLATPKVCPATEAARVQPDRPDAPAHDAFTRLLHRLEPDPGALWREVAPLTRRAAGVLVIDDTVLDKPHARHMGLVAYHWSGRHRRVVRGISLATPAWTDGDRVLPTDYRLVDPAAAPKRTKNDDFRDLARVAHERGFRPGCVAFDAWYSGQENLKAVRACGWVFLTQVRCNRRVNPDRTGNRPIRECVIAAAGTAAHLEGFGPVKAFRIAARDGDTEHWITNDLSMGEAARLGSAERSWGSRSTTGGSSSVPGWTAARRGCRRRSGTTSAARSGRSCGWSGIGSPPGSAGWRRSCGSSATPSGPTSPGRPSAYPKLQPRNSYPNLD